MHQEFWFVSRRRLRHEIRLRPHHRIPAVPILVCHARQATRPVSAEMDHRSDELEEVLREQRLGLFYRSHLHTFLRANQKSNQVRKKENELKTFCSKLNHIKKSMPAPTTMSKQEQWLPKSKIEADAWFAFVRHKYRKPLLKKLHERRANAHSKRYCVSFKHREWWLRNMLAKSQHAALTSVRVPIFIIGPDRKHALQLKRYDTVADLNDAVERLGYDLSVDRLCRLGGAPLPRDDHLKLDECGLHANSSLQVLGRLRGGVEVSLFGKPHSLGDTGLLDLKGQDVGPTKLKEVATFFSSPESSTVRRLVLSSNMITDRGKDLSGLKALCEVLPTLKHPISLDLANCGLGVAEVAEVAAAIHAGAALNSVTIDGNPIGYPSGASVKPGAETGVAVKKGAFAAVDGRFGEVVYLNGSSSVDIRWLDDGSKSDYIENDKLTSVVASRTDLIDDYSHIQSLGEALSTSKVKAYGLANCKFNPVSLATFVESVRWADAAVASLRCGNNHGMVGKLSRSGKLETPDAHAEVFKELTDSLKTSQVTEADFSACGLGPVALGHLGEWVREARAALNSISLSGNPLTGGGVSSEGKVYSAKDWNGSEDDLSGIVSLCEALPALKNPINLDLSNCGLSVNGVNPVAQAIHAGAAVARLMLDGNPLTGGTSSNDFDQDITGVTALFDSLKTSSVTELGLAKCRLGPGSLGKLAEYVRDAEAAIASLKLGCSQVGSVYQTGAAASHVTPGIDCLVTWTKSDDDIPAGDVGQIVEITDEGQKARVKFSKGTWKLSLSSLVVSDEFDTSKPCVFQLLCDALKTSKVTEVDFSSCGLGPPAIEILSDWVRDATAAALNSVTVDSTGDTKDRHGRWNNGGPKTYTLTLGDEKIDLSSKNLGPADVALVAAWLQRPEVRAAVADLNVSEATIGDAGNTLIEAISSSSTLNFITIGKGLRLPLKDHYDSDVLDASQKGIEPGGVAVIAWWLATPAAAALARLTLKENRGIGASGADPLMESICSTRNTCIVSIEHDVGALV